MKVLLTGGTGHLGAYACAALAEAGHEVVCASRRGAPPSAPFEGAAAPARPLAVDLAREDAVEILAAELGPDVALMHLAAWHPPATAATGPDERRRLLEVNVLGTMRALDAARRAGARKVVYASSFEVYGPPRSAPIREAHPTYPLTDYGASKLSGEHHARVLGEEDGVPSVALRMPAVYGPGERTPRALPAFLAATARGQAPTVFGDGEDLRDQLHVRDAARALLLALERGEGPIQVSDGEAHRVVDLARAAMAAAGVPGEPARRPRAKPRRDYHMDISRARSALGFRPRIGLAEGVREQLRWIRAGRP